MASMVLVDDMLEALSLSNFQAGCLLSVITISILAASLGFLFWDAHLKLEHEASQVRMCMKGIRVRTSLGSAV